MYSSALFFTMAEEKRHELERRIKAMGTPLFFTLPVNPVIGRELTRVTRQAKRLAKRWPAHLNNTEGGV